MIRRREFIAGLGGAAPAWPLAARAQRDRVRHIGVLMSGDETDPLANALFSAFTQPLAGLVTSSRAKGWARGRGGVKIKKMCTSGYRGRKGGVLRDFPS